jgi:oligoendopeptidase F
LEHARFDHLIGPVSTLFSWLKQQFDVAAELIALGADTIDDFKKRLPRLTRYDRLLEVTLRQAPHVLDPQRESLLASAGAIT